MDSLSVFMTQEESRLIQRTTKEVVQKYSPIFSGDPLITKEELFHCGAQGLLEARLNYDKAKQVPWLVFAAFRVRGAMLDHIRKLPMIKVSYGCYKKIKKMEKARLELFKTEGCASTSMIAAKLNWSVDEVNSVISSAQILKPAQKMTDDDSDEAAVYHLTGAGNDTVSSEDDCIRKELVEQLTICLQTLSDTDRLILISRTIEGTKLRELAESLTCSAENIRLRQKKAEKQMRNCLENNNWSVDQCLEVLQC